MFRGEVAHEAVVEPRSAMTGKGDRPICCHHLSSFNSIPCPLVFPFIFIIRPSPARLVPYAATVQAVSAYHRPGPLACVIIMRSNCSLAASSNPLLSKVRKNSMTSKYGTIYTTGKTKTAFEDVFASGQNPPEECPHC